MNFIVILAAMTAFWHESGALPSEERRGKFMGFSNNDMWNDLFDEIDDPLPRPSNSLSMRDHVLQKIQKTKKPSTEPTPPLSIPQVLVQTLANDTLPQKPVDFKPPSRLRPSVNPAPDTKKPMQNDFKPVQNNFRPTSIQNNFRPMPEENNFRPTSVQNHFGPIPEQNNNYRPVLQKPKPEPVLVYDTSTNKLEVTPPGFASRPPITEGMFLIGGQFEDSTPLPPNVTGLRIFWSSLGDVIEATPFLPIQVNVPDLIAAMTSFLAQRIPLFNRITNPNEPRPKVPNKGLHQDVPETVYQEVAQPVYQDAPQPLHQHMYQTPGYQYTDFPAETNLLEYRQMAPATKKPKKNKKKQKKNKIRRRTTERTPLRVTSSQATPRSSSKSWFARTTTEQPTSKATTESLKLFHHNNNPDSEQVKYKSTAFIRKNNRWADRELFNFRNSDISNSPIMILNMPSRPVYMYGFKHEVNTDYPNKKASKWQ